MTENTSANALAKAFRHFCAFFDLAVYTLLGFMYEIFFNVASADLLENATVLGFYKRVQLIIGVYMVFQFAIIIMKGIFDTDSVSEKNNNEFIKRIIIALIMLTVMTPISIPNPQNEYEYKINNNGLLFGTLYSLQYRILNNNTIGRLVLGTNDSTLSIDEVKGNRGDSELKKSANTFTYTILKGFVRINLLPEEQRVKPTDDSDPEEVVNENRMCQDIDGKTLDTYNAADGRPGDLLALINATCTPKTGKLRGSVYEALTNIGVSNKTKFVFSYMAIISTIVGIIFIVIMVSFTIDIAVRAIKLAVLRLIAPIPIISYMDPKGSKDGGFNAWVKTLTQTYLDLFIRLATVYFVIFIIQDMITNGIYMNKTTDAVGVISFIFICIGLFFFAKEAPKFLQKAIGMKDEPLNIFGKALATGGAMAGMIGSARTNYRASKEELENMPGHRLPQLDGLRNVGSAIAGAIHGGAVGVGAAYGKDGNLKKVLEAQSARNADRTAYRTPLRGIYDSAYGAFTGQSLATRGNKVLKGAQQWVKAQSDFRTALEKEAAKNGGECVLGKDENGNEIRGRYEELQAALAAADNGKFMYRNKEYNAAYFNKSFMDDALKEQVFSWQNGNTFGDRKNYKDLLKAGQKLYGKREAVRRALIDVDISGLTGEEFEDARNNFIEYKNAFEREEDNVKQYGKTMGAVNAVISQQENDMRQMIHRANNQQKGKQ